MNIVRWSLFLAVVVVAYPAVSCAATLGPTYGKTDESVTGGAGTAEGGDCTETADSTDQQAMDALRLRNRQRAKALEAQVGRMRAAQDERQDHIADLNHQISANEDLIDRITRDQSGDPNLPVLRRNIADLQRQERELSDYWFSQEGEIGRLRAEAAICRAGTGAGHHGVPVVGVTGEVLVRRAGESDFRPLTDVMRLNWGDTIQTGADGVVTLRQLDGSTIKVGPNSSLTVREEALYYLLFGDIRCFIVRLRNKFEVNTISGTGAVRGTEFTVKVGATGPTRFGVIDSNMDLTATENPPGQPPYEPPLRAVAMSLGDGTLPTDALAAIGSSVANTRIKRKGGGWQPAAPGETLREGDLLKTGPQARVPIRLGGGFSAALAPGSVLQVQRDSKGRALYGLWSGSLYGRRGAPAQEADRDPVFTSPSAVCAVRGTEFEYTVKPGQPPEFIVYHGALEVTADGKRLKDPALLNPWWEE